MGSAMSRELRALQLWGWPLAALPFVLQVLQAKVFDDPIDRDEVVGSNSSDSP